MWAWMKSTCKNSMNSYSSKPNLFTRMLVTNLGPSYSIKILERTSYMENLLVGSPQFHPKYCAFLPITTISCICSKFHFRIIRGKTKRWRQSLNGLPQELWKIIRKCKIDMAEYGISRLVIFMLRCIDINCENTMM